MTVLASVMTQLVAILDAATTVPVYDSETVATVKEWEFVIVGGGFEPEESEVARTSLDESSMGNHWTDESGSVECIAYSANTDSPPVARTAALALASTCRAAVLADLTLGGLLVMGGRASVSDIRLVPRQDESGFGAGAVFTVSYTTTLTT